MHCTTMLRFCHLVSELVCQRNVRKAQCTGTPAALARIVILPLELISNILEPRLTRTQLHKYLLGTTR